MKSGSGKTSLFKLLLGLLEPDNGEIYIDSIVLNKKNLESVRRKIFYLDQDISLPDLPLRELFELITNYKSTKESVLIIDDFRNYLFQLDLDTSYLDKRVGELSGGERQRVGLALGFTMKRPLWLLDEPTSALDSELKARVVSMIDNLGATVLVISHDDCWMKLKKLEWNIGTN